jgi:hypothetical protein
MTAQPLSTLTNEEYDKLSSNAQSDYNAGWRARANKEKFETDEAWYWKRGWKDADNDPVLRSEKMMK